MSHRCCVCSHQTAALFCAKWRQDIKSKLWFVQLMYIYLKNNPARFHPDPIWINGASGCFLKKMPKQQQEHQCNIRSVGTTVFCGTQNFEPSRGICPFPWNFYVFTEFYRTVIRVVTHSIFIQDHSPSTDNTPLYQNTAHFGGVQAAVLYVYMISPWHTWLLLGLWWEEYWKYWAELIWNIACLFGRDCICQLQLPATNTAYLVGFRGHRKLVSICGKYAPVRRGIWQTGLRNLEKFAAENCGP